MGGTRRTTTSGSRVDVPPIQRLLAFQTILDGVFERFADLDESGFDGAIEESLQAIGTFVGTDRSYVIRYDASSQRTWMTHEWCAAGIEPSFADEQGRSFNEAPLQQARLERFEVNEIRDVAALGDDWAEDRRYLEGQGIGAILEVPLVRHGRLVGVIGLDSTSGAVPWTAEDVTMLRAVAALFAQVSERRLADDDLANVAEQLRTTVRALQQAEERFESLVDRLPVAVMRLDRNGDPIIRNANAASDRLTEGALGQGASPLADAVRSSLDDGATREVEFSSVVDGRSEWREATVQPEFDEDGDPVSVIVVVDDTTERHEHETELTRAVTHDTLTGLPNRAMITGLLDHAATTIGTTLRSIAVLFVDLDRFKIVNDSLGHQLGDDLLVAVAHRLGRTVPTGGTVARLGADEFAILLEDHDEVSACAVADRLLRSLTEPIELSTGELRTTASVGVASTTDPDQVDQLLRRADVAAHRAKRNGQGGVVVHEDELSETVAGLLDLDQRLRRAVEFDEFTVAYQPVVDLTDGSVQGAEALVRWRPDGGDLVAAGAFVPLAERNGTIVAIGEVVLRTACATASDWITSGIVGPGFLLSVNLSARQLDEHGCVDKVLTALDATGLAPANLCLEVTETAALSDIDRAADVLHAVRGSGVRIAVDDFGTGYGSLRLLQQLPVDRLKIDRSFVSQLPGDPVAAAVTRAVIELADALGLDLVAEGVEDESQRTSLLALGCPTAQGYLLGRPVDAEEFHRRFTGADR